MKIKEGPHVKVGATSTCKGCGEPIWQNASPLANGQWYHYNGFGPCTANIKPGEVCRTHATPADDSSPQIVRINTSDVDWIMRHATDRTGGAADPVTYGTDIRGVMYFTADVEVGAVEHVRFAGADCIRFDLGDDTPSDHARNAMYPATYHVGAAGSRASACVPHRHAGEGK